MHVQPDQLKLAFGPSAALYVLIDPLVGEPVPGIGASQSGTGLQLQREQAWDREISAVVLADLISLPRHQHPYLVRLHGPADPWIELTLRIADDERAAAQTGGLNGTGGAVHRIGAWLQSEMRSQDLAELVSRMCRLNTVAVTSARYLRLADRRVLDLIRHVAGSERLARQFGGLQRWVYLDATAQLQVLQTAGAHTQPLQFSLDEWRRIERAETIHKAIGKYLGEVGKAEAPAALALYQAAEQAAIDAGSAARRWPHRFTSLDDDATWAALLLIYPSLARLPAVQQLLASQDAYSEPLRYLHLEIAELARSAQAQAAAQ